MFLFFIFYFELITLLSTGHVSDWNTDQKLLCNFIHIQPSNGIKHSC